MNKEEYRDTIKYYVERMLLESSKNKDYKFNVGILDMYSVIKSDDMLTYDEYTHIVQEVVNEKMDKFM